MGWVGSWWTFRSEKWFLVSSWEWCVKFKFFLSMTIFEYWKYKAHLEQKEDRHVSRAQVKIQTFRTLLLMWGLRGEERCSHIPKVSRQGRNVVVNTQPGRQWRGNGLQIRNTQHTQRAEALKGKHSEKCNKRLKKTKSIKNVNKSSLKRSCMWIELSRKADLLTD